ncbi:NACHT domain-containing protein [Actinocorallia populi]|uniref:NACHT domain-containing protein n=1 Tax=Actinocorallia populi TaxID=2079200 RepID=UPI001300B11E|nr:NACHT domain-containing protein [Actinocorallia populi]
MAGTVAVGIAVNQVLNDDEWNLWALGIAVAIAAAAEAVNQWLEHLDARGQAGAVTPETVRSAAEVLARLVKAQWTTEAAIRSLDDPDPIPVRWRSAEPEMMDHPRHVARSKDRDWSGRGDRIDEVAAWFRRLRRTRLVVLGEPGSGKTTLAVQLVRELLAVREDGEPVPVLLSVSGWDAAAQPDVWEWLAEQLHLGYPALSAPDFGGHAHRELTRDRMVLPVLDGLDEMPAPARAAVLKALNASLGTGGLILTCRTREYDRAIADAASVLTGAAVIRPEPLSPKAAAAYLVSVLPPVPPPSWQVVLDTLAAGGRSPLARVCSTPLGLWLVRTTQDRPGADPAALADIGLHPTAAALRSHLFDRLVPVLVAARPPTGDPADLFRPRRRHDPDDVTRWLGHLAGILTHPRTGDGRPRTRDFTWWHLGRDTLTPARRRITAGLAVCLPAGLAFGVSAGLYFTIKSDLRFGVSAGYLVALVMTLLAGATAWFSAAGLFRSEPGHADLSLRGRTSLLFAELAYKVALGIPIGLVISYLGGVPQVIAGGLVFGLTMGLVTGFAQWAEVPASTGRPGSPLAVWRADRALVLLQTASLGLALGLVVGLISGFAVDVPFGLMGGVLTGLMGGLLTGSIGGKRAWLGYLVATFWLARDERLPRRLMPFLDDAHRLGLLRAVGPLYQFRHAEFQDHLAACHEPSSP